MRIGIVSPYAWDVPGGVQFHIRDLAEELFRLRIRHTSGQLDSPAMMGRVRKDIARIQTVLRQKEVAGS